MAWISPIDSTYDRYSRVFMFSALLVSSILMMVEHFSYRMHCIIPPTNPVKFVNEICWSNGLFLYKEMMDDLSIKSHYYGIPNYLPNVGIINQTKELCRMYGLGTNEDCIFMNRVHFKEYQWLPFYFCILSFLYLLPYVIFKMVNPDLYSLHHLISSISHSKIATLIVQSYFNKNVNGVLLQYFRVFLTLVVKTGYIAVNVFAFLYTGSLLKGDFRSYGSDVVDWGDRNKSIPAVHPKKLLLPTTGICEHVEISKDIKHAVMNTHLFLCEITSNTFYQNMLLFHWYIFVFGITMSVTGLIVYIGQHVLNLIFNVNQRNSRMPQTMMTLRGMEYLDLIKEENIALYGEAIKVLEGKCGNNEEARNIIEEGTYENYQL